jgi:hypothetical protein
VFIVVIVYSKEKDSNMKNRKLPCYICGLLVFQMPRHLRTRHMNERGVASAVAKGAFSPEMRKLITLGIFNHNVSVLKDGEGVLLIARSSSSKNTW